MSKIIHFDVSRGLTIMKGYESDKPHFSMRVELAEGDDFYAELGDAIDMVNAVLLTIHESGTSAD